MEQSLNSPAAEPQALSMGEKLSYGAGEIASNIAWNMVTGFLLFYYSDVALLPVAALGGLMLVTRVLDAIFDPMVGIIVDRTSSRYGKARPYLLYATVPFGILCVATFSVPELSPVGKLAYAYVTLTLLGLLYSLLYIPYSALLPLMTRNPAEKNQLGSFRSMGTSLASIFVYGLTMPIVGYVGAGNRQHGFTVAAVIMASISALLYLLVFRKCRERTQTSQVVQRVPVKTSIAQMFSNRVWRIVFIMALLIFIKLGVLVSSVAYFTKDVLQMPWMISVLLPLLSVAILIGGFSAGLFFKRYNKRVGNIAAIAISILLTLAMPFFQAQAGVFIALFVLSNIVTGVQAATTFVMMADAVEVHEMKFNNRADGLVVSSVSFGIKVGMAVGTALTAFALGWAGYNPADLTHKTSSVVASLFYVTPVVLMILQVICLSFYRYDEVRASRNHNAMQGEGAPKAL
ncbi:Inner membrane symporter YicJ [Caballeronia hypogeia]|uniref:Inner membrane symporter YicJ n=1 Tax=Caballeronia hypogeia TaxID=1777140 RepID=A0A158CVM2_9BURK|nr:glycoside-pentoside-hexuronide (GPH):cation symporter [Caballeronia hypogeia]SAK86339.1 Inner membrane symporter YicJ [Caballeronia hypogeia]